MKRIYLKLLILSFTPALLFAQVVPDWWESTSREMHYPKDMYFTGFVYGEQQAGESIETTFARLKDEARVEAAASVKTHVQKEMLNSNSSELIQSSSDFDERITEVFRSKTQISVNVEIQGLNVDVYQNPQTGELAAFAYASRVDVERKAERQITMLLSKLEMILQNANQLIVAGQKMQARKTAEKALPMFAAIEELQKLLLSISDNSESLQLNETHALRQQFIEQLAFLKHGIIIYLTASCRLFDEPYNSLSRKVAGQLSAMGCEFADNADDSDWAIYIESKAREYTKAEYGNFSSYTAYVDVSLTIDKMVTHQRVYHDEIHQKGIHTLSYQEAARQAYDEVVEQVSTIIKQQIGE